MSVRDFVSVFSHGRVCFRLRHDDETYPVLCRSDVDKGHFDNISPLHIFDLWDCRIIDIIQTHNEVVVFISE